ncbi:MAG: DNA-processing protein DprA, partial [Candidatus Omnitrophica bacterium]|nr:DNA-processing protein DprA [Candidatus Omnitrophota bacterium]
CSYRFAFSLAELGITVVSGMARGIDTQAHRGALKAKGRTIAVMGSGFSFIYPKENTALVDEITSQGAVLTEFPCSTEPFAFNFPRRNRIISGLSLGVLVVEAGRKSGALITANFALEQNREVFCIPGRFDSPNSLGTHQLIKEGAKLVCGIEDILEELNINSFKRDEG